MLAAAVDAGASDIHLDPQRDGHICVRWRCDGCLVRKSQWDKDLSGQLPALLSRIKVLAGLDVAERRLPQDGSFRFNQGEDWDVRIATAPTILGERLAMRLLRTRAGNALTELGMTQTQVAVMRNHIRAPQGMILMAGPTGCGKTTTVYAALREIDRDARSVISIEDPVEYVLKGASQVQVRHDLGFDFATALRASLRHDPEVIFVGEIRDAETAEIAFRAGLTGHLVVSTIHTLSAAMTEARLRDMGLPIWLIRGALRLVISQRLVRLVCEFCKSGSEDDNTRGCAHCQSTGYRGRSAVCELLEYSGDSETAPEVVGESMRVAVAKRTDEAEQLRVLG